MAVNVLIMYKTRLQNTFRIVCCFIINRIVYILIIYFVVYGWRIPFFRNVRLCHLICHSDVSKERTVFIKVFMFHPILEDYGKEKTFLRNVENHLPSDTVPHPRVKEF